MDNSIDILYYESMMDSIIEDRKIMELVIESKYTNCLLKENTEELAIYEANVFQNIMDAMVKLFEKVVQFIKNLLENITNKKFFRADRKLIDMCTEKIKSITREEKDNFKILSINSIDAALENIPWANLQMTMMDSYLDLVIKDVNKFLAKRSTSEDTEKASDEQLDKIRKNSIELNEELDKKFPKEESLVTLIEQNAKNMIATIKKLDEEEKGKS